MNTITTVDIEQIIQTSSSTHFQIFLASSTMLYSWTGNGYEGVSDVHGHFSAAVVRKEDAVNEYNKAYVHARDSSHDFTGQLELVGLPTFNG